MKFAELPSEVQRIAADCVSQLVVNGAEPTKELALSVRDVFVAMHETVVIEDAGITQAYLARSSSPCGDEPFIYSGNLDLDSLIRWLEDEFNKLRAVRGAIANSRAALSDLIKEASAVIQCQPLINNLHHHQGSSLFSDSNQYSKDLAAILTQLDTSLILSKNYQGVGLQVKQIPSAEELMCSAHQMSNDI